MRNQYHRIPSKLQRLAYIGMIGIAINNRDCIQGVPGEHRLIPARCNDCKCGLEQRASCLLGHVIYFN